jgi:hypothetical protein
VNDNSPQKAFQHNKEGNTLWQYVQSLSPETLTQLSQPQSREVAEIIEHNIIGLLGNLPHENFDVEISTSRENLGRLLATAMMSGYLLRNAEQRMSFEKTLLGNNLDK